MDLEELRAFVAVAEAGSLLKAASTLGVSRTTLRRRIEALEAHARVRLLVRTQRGLVTTGPGEVLLQRGRNMANEAKSLLESIRQMGDQTAGLVRIAIPVGMPPQALGPWLNSLRKRHPHISIDLTLTHKVTDLTADEVDVAVHWGTPSPSSAWITRNIVRVRQWLIASRRYLKQHGAPSSVDELSRHALLVWRAPEGDPRVLPGKRGARTAVEPAFVSRDIHLLRQCAILGMGIAFVPDAMIPDPGIAAGEVCPVLEDVIGCDHQLRLSIPRLLTDVPKVRAVADHARLLDPDAKPRNR